jgi:hypothetical protein
MTLRSAQPGYIEWIRFVRLNRKLKDVKHARPESHHLV